MKKNTKRFITSVVALSMAFTTTAVSTSVAVTADELVTATTDSITSGSSIGSIEDVTVTAAVKFDTSLNPGADGTALEASQLPEGMGVEGTVTWKSATKSVEIAKNSGGAITVKLEEGDTVVAGVTSTSGDKTSGVAIADESGSALVSTQVTGSTPQELKYTATKAGTYKIISPADSNKRGARVCTVEIIPAGGSTQTTTITTTDTSTQTTTDTSTQTTTITTTDTSTQTTTTSQGGSGSGSTTTGAVKAGIEDFVSGLTPEDKVATGKEFSAGTVVKFITLQECVKQDYSGTPQEIAGGGYESKAALKSNGTNNVKVDGNNARGIGYIVVSEDITVNVDLKVGDGKKAYIFKTNEDNSSLFAADTTSFNSADAFMPLDPGAQRVKFDAEKGSTYYLVGVGTNLELFDVSAGEDNGGSGDNKDEDKVAGAGKIAPEQTSYEVKPDGSVAVKFKYEGVGVNNITGFFTYDPTVVVMTDATVTAKSEDGKEATASLEEAIKRIPDATIGGYEKDEIGGKTEAQLGKVKVGEYFADGNDVFDAKTVEFVLTFEGVGADNGAKTGVAFEAYGDLKNAANAKINLTSEKTEVVVNADAIQKGAYGISTSLTNKEGDVYTIGENDETFTVTITADQAFDANSLTAMLSYDDPNVVQLVSAEGSDLIPTDVITAAIGYVPTSANKEMPGADGKKTAAELGYVKLANVIGVDNNTDLANKSFAKGDTVAKFTFKKVAGGTSSIKFENIQTADNELNDTVDACIKEIKVKAEGEVKPNEKIYHIYGDINHNGIVDMQDAAKVFNYSLSIGIPKFEEEAISDVHCDGLLTAADASKIATKAINDSTRFGGYKDGVNPDIIVEGALEFIPISSTDGDPGDKCIIKK